MAKKPAAQKSVEVLKHDEAKRKNIPTAEFQSVLEKEQQDPKKVQAGTRSGQQGGCKTCA
jgi:adenine-specific DNA-methyltransferase